MRRALVMVFLMMGAAHVPVSAQRTGSEDAAAFWRSLDDPALSTLITTALDGSNDIAAAAARVNAARSARTHAALDLAPAVTAAGGYNRQRLAGAAFPGGVRPPEQSMWDAGIQLNWEIDVFGSGRRALAARNELLHASEQDRQGIEIAIAADVADAWFELRSLLERRAVALQNAENQRRTLSLTQTRLDAGRGTALDTERAQAQLSSTLADVPLIEAAILRTQHRLAVLIGRQLEDGGSAATPADVPIDLPALVVPDADEVVRARPDVRAAAARAAAGSASVGAARTGYLPRFSIAGTAGYTANELDGLGRTGPARYAVGPMISWPLLDLGRVRASVDAARAEQSQHTAHHRQTVLTAHAEIAAAQALYDAARERLAHLADASAASVRATAIARLRFEEGTTGFMEVLDAERRQLEAQERLAAGRAEAAALLVDLYRATGGELRADGG